MVITMATVGVVQVPIDQIVRVIAMGDGGVTAIGTMNMVGGMPPAGMILGASIRIGRADGDGMLLDHFAVLVVEVTIMDIVDMSFVLDRGVATAGTMGVVMVIVVFATFRHGRIPWVNRGLGYSVIGRKRAQKHPFQEAPASKNAFFDFPEWCGVSVPPSCWKGFLALGRGSLGSKRVFRADRFRTKKILSKFAFA